MRLLLLVPEVAFAEALAALLGATEQVTAAQPVSTAAGLRSALATGSYDVLLLESDTAQYDAVDLVQALVEEHPDLGIVVLSGEEEPDAAAQLLSAGALCWIRKSASATELADALCLAARGQASVPPDMLAQVIRRLAATGTVAREAAELLASLTPRERDVLEAMVEGLSRREIAERLFLSVNTVRTHVQHVLAKLHVHTALEAVAVAIQMDGGARLRSVPTPARGGTGTDGLPRQRWTPS
jgi:two-component system NarL family response regulator